MKTKTCISLIILMMVMLYGVMTARDSTYTSGISWKMAADSGFANLNTNYITTGILSDKFPLFIPLNNYTGLVTDSIVNQESWWILYNHMKYSTLDQNFSLQGIETLDTNLNQYNREGIIPIVILNTIYSKIKSNAFSDSLLVVDSTTSDGIFRYYDVQGRLASPYEDRRLFAAACYRNSSFFGEVKFRLDTSQFYFSNDTSALQSIYIDFDNGTGFATYPIDTTFTVSYTTSGKKTIGVKVITQTDTLYSSFDLTIEAQVNNGGNQQSIQSNGVNALIEPDNIWRYTSDGIFDNATTTGKLFAKVYVLKSYCGNPDIKKPVLLIEGYDPENTFNFEDFVNPNGRGYDFFINELREKGYDVLLVDFGDGGAKIQDNAEYIQTIINDINNSRKVGNQELIVIGASMGGLVARYALADMEENNVPHHTRLFISFDSPHKGANVPLGLQWNTVFWKDVAWPVPVSKIPGLKTAWAQLQAPAGKQMLVYHINTGGAAPDPMRYTFMHDLQSNGLQGSNGYPQKLRKIAVINGSEHTLGQGYNPHDEILSWDHDTFLLDIETHAWAVPDASQGEKLTGHAGYNVWVGLFPVFNWKWYYTGADKPYDNSPGGYEFTQYVVAEGINNLGLQPASCPQNRYFHSFVPSVSGLDIVAPYSDDLFYDIANGDIINTNKTPFDAYYAGYNNERHATLFNYSTLRKIIDNEIMAEDLFLQNETISTAIDYEATHTITAGKNVAPSNWNRVQGDFVVSNSASVNFRAGRRISLKDGFKSNNGGFFHAKIEPVLATLCYGFVANQQNDPFARERVKIEESVLVRGIDESSLIGSYPNPTTGIATIEYYVQASQSVSIVITDTYGRKIAEVINDNAHPSGKYKIDFDGSNIPAGIYFYTLRTPTHSETRQMIIVR